MKVCEGTLNLLQLPCFQSAKSMQLHYLIHIRANCRKASSTINHEALIPLN